MGVLVGVPFFFHAEAHDQQTLHDVLATAAVVLAWSYGIVCGAMLLASEREGGTQSFLDSLPISRLQLWVGKVLAGALFVLCQMILLTGIASVQVLFPRKESILGPLLLVYCAASGFGWGILFSAYTSNVLRAIGLAILFHFIAAPAFLMLVVIVLEILTLPFNGHSANERLIPIITAFLHLVVPFAGLSFFLYTGRIAAACCIVRPTEPGWSP